MQVNSKDFNFNNFKQRITIRLNGHIFFLILRNSAILDFKSQCLSKAQRWFPASVVLLEHTGNLSPNQCKWHRWRMVHFCIHLSEAHRMFPHIPACSGRCSCAVGPDRRRVLNTDAQSRSQCQVRSGLQYIRDRKGILECIKQYLLMESRTKQPDTVK